MKSIFDRDFKYTPSWQTNVSVSIKKEQKRIKQKQEAEAQHRIESAQKIRSIR